MTATNNRIFERLDEIGYFHLNKFNPLSLQICVIWKSLHSMRSLVESVRNQTTQRFTIMEKLNILKQTVSKKIITRMANNGCGEDFYVSHAVINRTLEGPPVTSQERWRHSRKRVFRIWKGFYKWTFEKKRIAPLAYLIYLLNIYVKRKCMFLGIYMPFFCFHENYFNQ